MQASARDFATPNLRPRYFSDEKSLVVEPNLQVDHEKAPAQG